MHLLGGPLIFSVFRLLIDCEEFTSSGRLRLLLTWDDSYSFEICLVHQILILGDFSHAIHFSNMLVIVILLAIIWSLVAGYVVYHLSMGMRNVIETKLVRAIEG